MVGLVLCVAPLADLLYRTVIYHTVIKIKMTYHFGIDDNFTVHPYDNTSILEKQEKFE